MVKDLERIERFDCCGLKIIIDFLLFSEINANNRKKINVRARVIFAKVCRKKGFNMEQIGLLLGKDHSIISYYLTKYKNFDKQNDEYYTDLILRTI